MSDFVLGTAGHIDHGKTSLIKALTGINTDRLKEEVERGITIEIGFAFLTTNKNNIIGIVDVPGHEKFIKNMVAGVSGIDFVALVIAADEGIMPQTIEHIEICELLGIKGGLIVVTKIDTVDKDFLGLIIDEINDFKQNTFLKDSQIIPVSSKTGEGIEELKNYLFTLADQHISKSDNGYFIMPIDRVFTMKGFGTVATGTTVSGEISVGDDITLLPSKLSGKVRTIQIHNTQSEKVRAGHRTAINIQGIYVDDIKRGDKLTTPDIFSCSNIIDAKLKYLSSNNKPLKNRIQVKFHSGTLAIPAKIIILDKDEVKPAEDAFIQIILEKEHFTVFEDRYIIRSFDDKKTLGGGTILDGTAQKKKRFELKWINYLQTLEKGTLKDKIKTIMNIYGEYGISIDFIISKTNLKKEFLLPLINQIDAIIYDKKNLLYITKDNFEKLKKLTISNISEFHKINPKLQGIPSEELRNKITKDLDYDLFDLILTTLEDSKEIKIQNSMISIEKFNITLNDTDQSKKDMIYKLIKNGALAPPLLNQLQQNTNLTEKETVNLLNILTLENKIVKIKYGFFMDNDIYTKIKYDLINYLKENKEITIQDFKKVADTSRKYLIPLIEHFDSIKLTIRKGDNRVLKS